MKKYYKYTLLVLCLFALGLIRVQASPLYLAESTSTLTEDSVCSLCYEVSNQVRFVGYIILVAKIIIPIVLLALCTMDIFKAVTKGDQDVLSKSVKTAMRRALAAIIIFFVPTFVNILLDLVNETTNDNGTMSEYKVCATCLFTPSSDSCKQIVEGPCEAKFTTAEDTSTP